MTLERDCTPTGTCWHRDHDYDSVIKASGSHHHQCPVASSVSPQTLITSIPAGRLKEEEVVVAVLHYSIRVHERVSIFTASL